MVGISGLQRRRSTEGPITRMCAGIGGGDTGALGSWFCFSAAARSISIGRARARFAPAESPARMMVSFAAAASAKRVGRRLRRIGRESAAGDLGARG